MCRDIMHIGPLQSFFLFIFKCFWVMLTNRSLWLAVYKQFGVWFIQEKNLLLCYVLWKIRETFLKKMDPIFLLDMERMFHVLNYWYKQESKFAAPLLLFSLIVVPCTFFLFLLLSFFKSPPVMSCIRNEKKKEKTKGT